VTLNTEFRAELKVGHTLVFIPVRLVAAHAVERYILVPRIYRFYSYRMRRMLRKVVALGADFYHSRLGQEQDRIGGMRGMTGSAHPILYGLVLGQCLFLPRDCVLMTTAAEARHRVFLEKCLLFGCVRAMTVHATSFIEQGPMNPVLR
jgi:hypothetical protein